MSDITRNNVRWLDFLGFNFDVFVSKARKDRDASLNSPYFDHPDARQVEALEYYAREKNYKVKIKADVRGSFLVYPCVVVEVIRSLLGFAITSNNVTRTMSPMDPMMIVGSTNTTAEGSICQPDLEARVIDRTLFFPNLIVETHHRSSLTVHAFHARLLSFFKKGVMIAVGFCIFERNQLGTFEALVIVYERSATNQPVVSYNVSFGTAGVSTEHANEWANAAEKALSEVVGSSAEVPVLVGYGVDDTPPCTAAAASLAPYQITLSQCLMLCTNSVLPYTYHPDTLGPTAGMDFAVNLFQIQLGVDRTL